MKSHRKTFTVRTRLFGSLLIVVGLACWLLLSPNIITSRGASGAFISPMNWVGFIVCMLGVGLVFYGIGQFVSE
jgi:hypothetical protein